MTYKVTTFYLNFRQTRRFRFHHNIKLTELRDVFRKKKRYYVGIFPILGGAGGLTHSHLFMFVLPSFFLACQNHPEMLKHSLLFF